MKNILTAILLLLTITCSAQVTTRILAGYNPVNGQPFKIPDTLHTLYAQSPLYLDKDTLKTIGGGQWNLKTTNGINNIYNSNTGKVGVNDSIPLSQFTVTSNTNTTVAIDSTGILLKTPFASTSTLFKASGPLVFEATGQNIANNASVRQRARFVLYGTGSGNYPIMYFQVSKDSGVTYNTVWNNSGTTLNLPAALTGVNASFTSTVAAASVSSGTSGAGAISTNNFAAGGAGQLSVGDLPDYTYPDAIFAMYSNSQGMLLPVLTSSQRDSINQQIASVVYTNGGTGYTSPPTITIIGGTAMNARGTGGSTSGAITAVLTGTSVTGYTIVRTGAYLTRPTGITFSGGGGSGAAGYLVMTQGLHVGLTIYNSTVNAVQRWNGSRWVNIGLSNTATLSTGTVTVNTSAAVTGSKIFVSYNTISGTPGFLSVPDASIVSGTSFTINSSSALDNSTVNWSIQ